MKGRSGESGGRWGGDGDGWAKFAVVKVNGRGDTKGCYIKV